VLNLEYKLRYTQTFLALLVYKQEAKKMEDAPDCRPSVMPMQMSKGVRICTKHVQTFYVHNHSSQASLVTHSLKCSTSSTAHTQLHVLVQTQLGREVRTVSEVDKTPPNEHVFQMFPGYGPPN